MNQKSKEANNNNVKDVTMKSDINEVAMKTDVNETVLTKYKDTSQKFERERHSQVFQHKLASLNKSVSTWITTHVEENACVDLTPIFNDYKNHLEKIDSEYKKALAELDNSTKNVDFTSSIKIENGSDTKPAEQKSMFGFLSNSTNHAGLKSDTGPSIKPFMFGRLFKITVMKNSLDRVIVFSMR